MDYSLLVGVDEEKKELSCGLVDAIGAFTIFKALESKGKQLAMGSSGGEVTVVRLRLSHTRGSRSSELIVA